MNRDLIVHEEPKSPISEAFRSLRTNIQFTMNKSKNRKDIKTILVTSTFMGEGKSWSAANLAISFAQTGNKVILVDADMRKGRQHKIFDVPVAPGLSNFLSEKGETGKKKDVKIIECLRETNIPNLVVMPLGYMPDNPSELLLSAKMKELMAELSSTIDIVIVDAPPSTMVSDSIILSRLVDGTVIVVEYDKTKTDKLKGIIKNIRDVGGHILGIVINKIPVSKRKYESEYYYYGDNHLKVIK